MNSVIKCRETIKNFARLSLLLCLPAMASAQLALPTAMLSDAVHSLADVAGGIGANSLLNNSASALSQVDSLDSLATVKDLVRSIESSVVDASEGNAAELQVLEGASALTSIMSAHSTR